MPDQKERGLGGGPKFDEWGEPVWQSRLLSDPQSRVMVACCAVWFVIGLFAGLGLH
jgi:hypothetical protein